jgi:polysaccharide biosynthesis/export protein
MKNRRIAAWMAMFAAGSGLALAQVPQGAAPQAQPELRPDYVLGPNDQILVHAPLADDINDKPFRIDSDGFINFPESVGRVRGDGLTVRALESELVNKLKETIREPVVSIQVTQYRNEPVSFLGNFLRPGTYPLQGGRTLLEMLTVVGGLQPTAGRKLTIQRKKEAGPIPLPNAVVDPQTGMSTVEISLESLSQNINPEENIILEPYDLVLAERAERVYIMGEVAKAAPIELGERASVSTLQAITEAGGFTQFAKRDKVVILRPVKGTTRRYRFEVDLNRVIEGKDLDMPLLPNDQLVVQRATGRAVFGPVGTTVLSSVPYLIITSILR